MSHLFIDSVLLREVMRVGRVRMRIVCDPIGDRLTTARIARVGCRLVDDRRDRAEAWVHMDRLLLEQTLAVLVLNARDAIAATGRMDGLIQLHVRVAEPQLLSRSWTTAQDQSWLCSTNPGATTKPADGLGIGLSLATAFVESAGGTLVFGSEGLRVHGSPYTYRWR